MCSFLGGSVDSFAPEDVRKYYLNSFIRHPKTNAIVQVAEVDRERSEALYYNMKGGEVARTTLKDILWDHVRIPRLGYRSTKDKNLYYITKKVGSITVKGVNPHTIAVETNVPFATLVRSISENEYVSYINGGQVRRGELIEQIFEPVFKSLDEAVKLMLLGKAYASALSHDFALALGKRADRALTLFWKGWQPVAYSEDGERWVLVHEGYKDVIKRSLGDIRYA